MVGGTLSCIGQNLILDWGSTPPQSVYNLCLVFRFGFATMSLVSLFLLPSAQEPHSALVFLVGASETYFKKNSGCHFNLFLNK